ncbi:sorting nexin-10 [Rana temporaria]|uniref:sorting nexin-10 n=1 Tax=Rana temporaria TaxID=8407 RepID=UPI001AACA8D2|nr:sorting nexin-10 [Rana temporaria]
MFPRDKKGETICIWVRDPKIQKEDWHSYLDYEICIHTNSMCFTMKTSRVRRRFREFVWLRQKLQSNAVLIELPELPPKTPFFNISNAQTVEQRIRGLQEFLNKVVQCSLLLSDSRLHLFLQTQLTPEEIEACVSGQTKYSVADAIHKFAKSNRRFPEEEEEQTSCNVAPESSSVLGHPIDASFLRGCKPSKEQRDAWKTVLAPSPSK